MKRYQWAIILLIVLMPNVHVSAIGRNDTLKVPFEAFLNSLISSRNIVIDTSWKKNMDVDDEDSDWLYIAIPKAGDDPDNFVKFPFKDIRLIYTLTNPGHYDNPHYRFYINHQPMPYDTLGEDPFFHHIIKFSYFGKKYLVLTGTLRDYNGYGDRVHFNYFFDLSKPYKQDIYDNAWPFVSEPLLYGDLNNDHQLDRIKFDGVIYPSGFNADSTKDTITITAETYHYGKWRPLKDNKGKPYYIHVACDDFDENMVICDYHWMRKID